VKERRIKPLWALLAMLAAFPVTGLICAITYKDASMFYWSLVFIPIAIVVFPVVALVASFVWQPLSIIGLIISLFEKLRRRKN
jgi:hypothetical protein